MQTVEALAARQSAVLEDVSQELLASPEILRHAFCELAPHGLLRIHAVMPLHAMLCVLGWTCRMPLCGISLLIGETKTGLTLQLAAGRARCRSGSLAQAGGRTATLCSPALASFTGCCKQACALFLAAARPGKASSADR